MRFYTAIGLQYGFDTPYWVSTIPPILLILIFKMYCNRAFNSQFSFYIPNEQELRAAIVHSKRADAAGNRLEKRFGHPALTSELFTPMLHANQMELLPQVFSGKIGSTKTKLDEYGGTKMDASIVAGGIKIAGIEQVRHHSFIPPWKMVLMSCDPTVGSRVRSCALPKRSWRAGLGCSLRIFL